MEPLILLSVMAGITLLAAVAWFVREHLERRKRQSRLRAVLAEIDETAMALVSGGPSPDDKSVDELAWKLHGLLNMLIRRTRGWIDLRMEVEAAKSLIYDGGVHDPAKLSQLPHAIAKVRRSVPI
jgi:hypothetical protein